MSTIMFLLGAALVVGLGFALRPYMPDPAADDTEVALEGVHPGLLYGRVTTVDGELFEGSLRFGGDEEALWSNQFNGIRRTNDWSQYIPQEMAPAAGRSWRFLGMEVRVASRPDLKRPFLARFGDITQIEARGRDLRVTLKSGTVARLDRYAADDFADGVRVWDRSGRVVELGEREIRSIEFFAPPVAGAGPAPLFGTVQTPQGVFTGLIQWDREAALLQDRLQGRSVTGEPVDLRFDAVQAGVRHGREGATVLLKGGGTVNLARAGSYRGGHRGLYVDDPQYGRVLISWNTVERVELHPGTAPGYAEFGPGRLLGGTVTTHAGRSLSGRIVFDLDEQESTETLDAPADGVDYMIPFELIAGIDPLGPAARDGARLHLRSGEELRLEQEGDLGAANAGILIFTAEGSAPEYVPWAEVDRIELEWT